ncbi:hypothetical protein DL95DRAFT_399493 [Leptodontidium sp. 2 PMI_412]|nr:hypothetical protein DL95DRAFT_399493 [Leptodontidium sp. 2 PMI_412]
MADQSFYGELPFMIRRQDTDDCGVVLLNLDPPCTNSRTYRSLVSSIEALFSPSITNQFSPEQQGKLINKLEVRWLPRRGYDSEGYPHTLLLNEKNAYAMLKLILLRQGTDIIEVTVETDEEKKNRLSDNRYR